MGNSSTAPALTRGLSQFGGLGPKCKLRRRARFNNCQPFNEAGCKSPTQQYKIHKGTKRNTQGLITGEKDTEMKNKGMTGLYILKHTLRARVTAGETTCR